MVSVLVTVAETVAEYSVAPVFRHFGYLFNYKNNVDDLMEKVTSLKATRDGVQSRVDRANQNLETIRPIVEDWLERVNQIIQEKETRFEQGRLARATTCCPPTNLKVRHSLSRRATKMIPKLQGLITEGDFRDVADPAPAPKIQYEVIPYYEDSIQEAIAKPHEGASSSSNPTDQPAPEYRLPYTKDLLTALQDDRIHVIGISGGFREIDKVTTQVFIKRIKQRNLFDEVVMAVVSKDPDLNRIQGEIADRLQLKLENGSLHERAERLREATSKASDSKRLLMVLTHVCQAPDLEAIGISPGNDKKWKVMLISDLSNVFNEMETHGDFRLLLQSTPKGRAVEFESRKQVMRDVMDTLTDEETNPIVMYGMGGIGKTTLLREITAKASEVDLFGEVVIAIVTQDPNLSKIQGEIAKGLGLEFKDDESLLSRAAKLRERISTSTKSVLVILDDVWRPLNLWEEVGIPMSCYPKCCKVLVSSRYKDIFKELKTRKKFHIGGLSDKDAWTLLKKEAGNSIEHDPELKKKAEQVLEQCDGLPVAISAVGRALQGEGLRRWNDALEQLKKSSPDDVPGVIESVYSKIEFSYECLPSEGAKSCFLLCCIFPKSEDIEVESLVRMGLGLGLLKDINSIAEGRDRVQSLVDTIKGRCLLLESDGGEEGWIRMHDVVRDVAVYIASEMLAQKKKKNDHFGKRIVLKQQVELDDWRKDNDIEESIFCASLTTSTGGDTELLWLVNNSTSMLELPAETFREMEHLKVLSVSHLYLFPVMSTLPLVLKTLETLIIWNCRLQLDVIGALPTLKILQLGGFDVKELPGTFKHLSNLKLLDVRECDVLKKISAGVISSFSKLEELYMPHHFRFEWVTDKLSTTETTKWISQREEARGEEWKRFKMAIVDEERGGSEQSERDALTRWANSRDWSVGILSELLSLSRLTTLQVSLPPVNILLRNSCKLFRKLERFKISIGLEERTDESELEGYDNYLRVHDVDASSLVGTDIGSLFKKTNFLELYNLTGPLNDFGLDCFAKLKRLELDSCHSLECLIHMTLDKHTLHGEVSSKVCFSALNAFECFHNLTSLKVNGCHNLRYLLPSSIARDLVKLERLKISDCIKMEGIVAAVEGEESFECFHNLTFLYVTKCHNLRYLLPPSIARGLVKLERLKISDCIKMEGIVAAVEGEESFECFHNLTSLEVTTCHNLRYLLPPSIARGLVKLEELKIWDCTKMEGIVAAVEGEESFECFHNLTSLHVMGCHNLRYLLPPSIARGLVKLEELKIWDCTKMEGIVAAVEGEESFECFHNLTSLEVMVCHNLRYLLPPSIARGLVMLEDLLIYECEKIEGIVAAVEGEKSFECFHNLTSLHVMECHNLRYLLPPSIARGLVKLEELKIWDCTKMEGIVAAVEGEESFECFHNLTSLHVWRCHNLRYLLPPSIARGLVMLEDLLIYECEKIEGIVAAVEGEESFECFHNLTSLHVMECHNLRYLLPPSIARGLVKLEELKIWDCTKMEGIVAAVEGEEETREEGMLPRLKYLSLKGLPNLRSFKYNFAWPLLETIIFGKCTELKFCSGTLSIPREVEIHVYDCGPNLMRELNNCRKES